MIKSIHREIDSPKDNRTADYFIPFEKHGLVIERKITGFKKLTCTYKLNFVKFDAL